MKPTQTFPLLRLPREIRDEIYKSCLYSKEPGILFVCVGITSLTWTTPISLYGNRKQGFQAYDIQLNANLLRCNRQVYHEAIWILYSQTFVFSNPRTARNFLSQIGPKNSSYLKRIFIALTDYEDPLGAANLHLSGLLKYARNLQMLTLQVDNCYLRDTFEKDELALARKVYILLKGWLNTVAKTDDDPFEALKHFRLIGNTEHSARHFVVQWPGIGYKDLAAPGLGYGHCSDDSAYNAICNFFDELGYWRLQDHWKGQKRGRYFPDRVNSTMNTD
jgi:hypothetical protein